MLRCPGILDPFRTAKVLNIININILAFEYTSVNATSKKIMCIFLFLTYRRLGLEDYPVNNHESIIVLATKLRSLRIGTEHYGPDSDNELGFSTRIFLDFEIARYATSPATITDKNPVTRKTPNTNNKNRQASHHKETIECNEVV
jgi:hypothetical protein